MRSLLLASLALGLAACHQAPPPQPPSPPEAPVVAAPAPPPAPPGHLRRADVDQILVEAGPPWVFRRVILEPVMGRDGRFAGWRIEGLPEEWRGIDLHPGDVVSRVNGLAVENQDHAWEIWLSVARSPEIKFRLTRDGAAREVVVPIDGAPSPETLKRLNGERPAPRATAAPPPPPAARRSVQLGGGHADGVEEEAY